MEHLLFRKMKCNGYLKKVNDGRFIDRIQVGLTQYEYFYADTNNPNLNIECEQCGDLDFLKTYFKYKEKVFSGIVVGFKNIVATGYLTVDTNYDDYAGREYTRFGKRASKTIQCAIVYYANNRKRYVPIENILNEVNHETR